MFVIALSAISCASTPKTRTPASETALSVAASLEQVRLCSARIWPGFQMDSYRILLMQPSRQRGQFWEPGQALRDLSNEEAKSVQPDGSYNFITNFRGDRAVSVNIERFNAGASAAMSAFKTAFHEGFHFLYQMKAPWAAYFVSADRKPNVDRVEALYSRQMLIHAMKKALLGQQGWGEAVSWWQRWEKTGEAPETRWSDITEGTAYYAELVGSLLAEAGCEISESDLMKRALEQVPSLVDQPQPPEVRRAFVQQYVQTGYQKEGYEIGLLALLALRARGQLVGEAEYKSGRHYIDEMSAASQNADKMRIYAEMRAALLEVRTPVELLLTGVAPAPVVEDQRLRSEIETAFR